jgi:hypothetical protein
LIRLKKKNFENYISNTITIDDVQWAMDNCESQE